MHSNILKLHPLVFSIGNKNRSNKGEYVSKLNYVITTKVALLKI